MASTYLYHDKEIWIADWFIQLMEDFPQDYGFFFYIRDQCEHGVWRPSLKNYEKKVGRKINIFKFADSMNKVEQRMVFIPERGVWFLPFYWHDVHGHSHQYKMLHKPGVHQDNKKPCNLCLGYLKHLHNNLIAPNMIMKCQNNNDIDYSELFDRDHNRDFVPPLRDEDPVLVQPLVEDIIPHPVIIAATDLPERPIKEERSLQLKGSLNPIVVYPYDGSKLTGNLESFLHRANWDAHVWGKSVKEMIKTKEDLKEIVEEFVAMIYSQQEEKTPVELNKYFGNYLRSKAGKKEKYKKEITGSGVKRDYTQEQSFKK